MKDIFFSLIVPVYNVENYLGRCLDSILSQDYVKYEIICVNDGATDRSGEILCEYAQKYKQIKVITQENKGLGEARNTGMKYMTGDYVWFIDSDDWIEPGSLKTINDFHSQHPEFNVIIIDAYRTNAKGEQKVFNALPDYLRKVSVPTKQYIDSLMNIKSSPSAWIKIFKYDVIKDYQFSKGFYEDMPLIRVYKLNGVIIGYLGKCLYNYFYRDGSIVTKVDMRILDLFKQYDLIYDEFKNEGAFRVGLSQLLVYWTGRRLDTVRELKYRNIFDAILYEYRLRKSRVLPFWRILLSNIPISRKVKLLKYKKIYHL